MDMTFKEMAMLVMTRNIAVEFKAGVDEQEAYAEKGMRADVTEAVEEVDSVVRLTVAYASYEAFNQAFESANYWNADKTQANLTARQAGFYQPTETLYFSAEDPVSDYLVLLDDSTTALYRQFKASQSGLSYTLWLEARVRALEAAQTA